MSELNRQLLPELKAHVQEQLAVLAKSFNQCFDLQVQYLAVQEQPWLASVNLVTGQPGVGCLFQAGSAVAMMLVPESLLLPDWYKQPDQNQQGRMETLALEWSLNLFPDSVAVDVSRADVVDDLAVLVLQGQPANDAMVLRIPVRDIDQSELGDLLLVWPLETLPLPRPAQSVPSPPPPPSPAAAAAHPMLKPASLSGTPPAASLITPPSSKPAAKSADPLSRLRKLPVTVSVRLTERRISVSQMLAITPGALLTFSKSCDDLLDLYVNNALYCRGEAVKIGESFGLKINQIGVANERPSKIIGG